MAATMRASERAHEDRGRNANNALFAVVCHRNRAQHMQSMEGGTARGCGPCIQANSRDITPAMPLKPTRPPLLPWLE